MVHFGNKSLGTYYKTPETTKTYVPMLFLFAHYMHPNETNKKITAKFDQLSPS